MILAGLCTPQLGLAKRGVLLEVAQDIVDRAGEVAARVLVQQERPLLEELPRRLQHQLRKLWHTRVYAQMLSMSRNRSAR